MLGSWSGRSNFAHEIDLEQQAACSSARPVSERPTHLMTVSRGTVRERFY